MNHSRTFTLAEAQCLLPTLEQLLRTAMAAHHRCREIDQQLQALIARILVSGGMQVDPIRNSRLCGEREAAQQQLQDALGEITASGVQVKDLDQGLLDFPCRLEGKLVLLCWKLGETGIGHYHGTREGFARRKPLDGRFFHSGNSRQIH